jgi:beta-ketoacyl-acyl-carrier-protein synthase II
LEVIMERVVVTGMGTVNPLGHSVDESWKNILAGVSGVGPITLFNPSNLLVKIACEVKNFDPEKYIPSKEVRRRDRYEWFATAASQEALRQAGITAADANADRIGVIYSSAIGGINTLLDAYAILQKEGPRRISPFVIPQFITDGAAGMISIDNGFRGPTMSIISACASGTDAIGMAWIMIKSGIIDIAVTGASDAVLSEFAVGSFDRIGACSRRNDDYSMTPQPFDKNRDGLVIGEGAAALVLESESHARARGAEILAELAGYGSTSDAYHITAPREDGVGGAQAMLMALQTAGENAEALDYINAHGTSTILNDASETQAIKNAFGKLAYNIPISSTKSMTGHMMGATGALEAIICVQAILSGVLPATVHYRTPDPSCDLDYIPNTPRQKQVRLVISNSFGFGGHNAVIAIRRY